MSAGKRERHSRPEDRARTERRPRRPTRAERRARNQMLWQQAKEIERTFVIAEAHKGKSVDYSSEKMDALCDLVASGLTIRQACKQLDFSERTVRLWILDNRGEDHSRIPPVPGAKELIQRALIIQSDAWADVLIEIADDATEESVQLARFRSDQRKWLMGKNNRKYNDKFVVSGDPENPIKQQHEVMSDIISGIVTGLNAVAKAKRDAG